MNLFIPGSEGKKMVYGDVVKFLKQFIFQICVVVVILLCFCFMLYTWGGNVNSFEYNNAVDEILEDQPTPTKSTTSPKIILIVPGTKWCGTGNLAENENDFGKFRKTDLCCKQHDRCPDYMLGGETKFNITNLSFYLSFNCECDELFYKCLKSVKNIVSNTVGYIYFQLLHRKCYKREYPVITCKKYYYGRPKKCKEYLYDTTKNKTYQWFDVARY